MRKSVLDPDLEPSRQRPCFVYDSRGCPIGALGKPVCDMNAGLRPPRRQG
jgi:hypothetical protein